MAPLPFEPGSAVSASPGATENCRRVKYSAGAGAEPLPFCVNGALSFDLVSEHVTKHGRWPDCDLLPAQVRPCQTRTHTPAVRTPTRPRAHTPARPQVHPHRPQRPCLLHPRQRRPAVFRRWREHRLLYGGNACAVSRRIGVWRKPSLRVPCHFTPRPAACLPQFNRRWRNASRKAQPHPPTQCPTRSNHRVRTERAQRAPPHNNALQPCPEQEHDGPCGRPGLAGDRFACRCR